MSHPLFGPEIKEMLADADAAGLRTFCESLHPATVAEALDDDFTGEQIWDVLSPTDVRTQAAIFEYLPLARQIEIAEGPARPQVAKLIEKMSHDDRVDLLRRLPARTKDALLRLVDEADRRDIATLFSYGTDTVGSLMTTDYAWLSPTLTAAEAIDQLRQQAPDRETIYYIYVLGEMQRRPDGTPGPRQLLGVVSLRDLILAPRHAPIHQLMESDTVTLKFSEDKHEAAEKLARFDFIAMPVVDDAGGLVGIITHDDVIDVIQEQATENLQRQAGVAPLQDDYLDASFYQLWRSRVTWLAIVFVLQMFSINAMAVFEDDLKTVAALAAFVPLCLSVGGNTGSQAASLVIRALALEQVALRDWGRVFRRELLMGLALAASLGALSLARTWFLTPDNLYDGKDQLLKLTYAVSLSVMAICLWGALLGAMLPIAIRALGKDPALISSPAIATVSDVSGIIIYFKIADIFFFD
jgi:magnesium transporter